MAYLYLAGYAQIIDGLGGNASWGMVAQPPVQTLLVEIGAVSLQSDPIAAGVRVVELFFEENCHIACGINPGASTDNMKYEAGDRIYMHIPPGHRVAVIQGT